MLFTEFFTGQPQITLNNKNKDWYNTISKRITLMPPNWIFGVIWPIIYILIWISLFILYRNTDFTDPTRNYMIDVITILFILNIITNKMWTFVFFRLRRLIIALIMLIFIILSSITILIIFGINQKWLEFGLFIIYPIWCSFALYLNISFVIISNKINK